MRRHYSDLQRAFLVALWEEYARHLDPTKMSAAGSREFMQRGVPRRQIAREAWASYTDEPWSRKAEASVSRCVTRLVARGATERTKPDGVRLTASGTAAAYRLAVSVNTFLA